MKQQLLNVEYRVRQWSCDTFLNQDISVVCVDFKLKIWLDLDQSVLY